MRIGLGTAQFGLDYGITNDDGRVSPEEAESLLALAVKSGVDVLDTAPAYGASEDVLGRAGVASFRIVTKVAKIGSGDRIKAADQLRRGFEASLSRLRQGRVYGLLLHDPGDLLGPLGDSLWRELERLKSESLVECIGASFYEGSQIDEALSRYPLELVQVPYNAVDARLVDGGQLARLEQAGVEIHARSLFLQGLLLADQLPTRFSPLAIELKRLESAARVVGLTRLQVLLALAFRRTEISRFICGMTSTRELREILAACESAERSIPPDYSPEPLPEAILNPSRWNELSGS